MDDDDDGLLGDDFGGDNNDEDDSEEGHEFFLEVPEEFIEDDFNLTGLNTTVVLYNEALDMILDLEPSSNHSSAQVSLIESAAETLYGLIHQRYLLTRPALQLMAERLRDLNFGVCPRYGCGGMGTLPCGRSDQLGVDTAKYQNLDGAFFGTTFPHLLFLTFPELIPPATSPPRLTTSSSFRVSRQSHRSEEDAESKDEFHDAEDDEDDDEDEEEDDEDGYNRFPDYQIYVPKVFGFRVSERARTGPRMQWLRWKEGLPTPGHDDAKKTDGWGHGPLDHDGN
ncbi:casein kinase 2 regulatory subunit [Phlyctochytrium bullatum]|nr:casein kinase 2 regulatory subunit [Phlyctochytrium bullatum]